VLLQLREVRFGVHQIVAHDFQLLQKLRAYRIGRASHGPADGNEVPYDSDATCHDLDGRRVCASASLRNAGEDACEEPANLFDERLLYVVEPVERLEIRCEARGLLEQLEPWLLLSRPPPGKPGDQDSDEDQDCRDAPMPPHVQRDALLERECAIGRELELRLVLPRARKSVEAEGHILGLAGLEADPTAGTHILSVGSYRELG